MWPEISTAKTEKRHEIVLSGASISERISKDGLDSAIFDLVSINYLNISETILSNIPDEISNLENLQTLVLHSNKLESVNDKICLLSKLKVLDLSRNQLKSLPENITSLLNLVTLNISNNSLETFPGLGKNTKLTVLDLSNNKLKSFPNVCNEELVNLSEIKLNGNEIEEIPNNINVLQALKVFDVSSNKIKTVPGEIADCHKLKEINLKSNPISDRRLLKLMDQCRTKQVVDYIKQHCPKSQSSAQNASNKKGKKGQNNQLSETSPNVNEKVYKYNIKVHHAKEDFKVIVANGVKNVREHIICCLVKGITFTEDSFKRFIQIQTKLHETVCEKRNTATIATHDFKKIPEGHLTYTTKAPNELMIKPLNRATSLTGAELFTKLQTEANNLRKEKKRNVYSGIHKYLYLIEGKPQYPCLVNANNEVISFPPITNSDISKIGMDTSDIFIEVTSSVSQFVCKTALDTLLKEMVYLFDKDLEVQQVKTTDSEENLKTVYPSKADLNFEDTASIKIVRD